MARKMTKLAAAAAVMAMSVGLSGTAQANYPAPPPAPNGYWLLVSQVLHGPYDGLLNGKNRCAKAREDKLHALPTIPGVYVYVGECEKVTGPLKNGKYSQFTVYTFLWQALVPAPQPTPTPVPQ